MLDIKGGKCDSTRTKDSSARKSETKGKRGKENQECSMAAQLFCMTEIATPSKQHELSTKEKPKIQLYCLFHIKFGFNIFMNALAFIYLICLLID